MSTLELPTGLKLPSFMLTGDLAAVRGAERGGYNERADVIVAADGTDLNDFWDEILQTIGLRNNDRNRLIDAFSTRVVQPFDNVIVAADADFEEASEYGQPSSFRGSATRFFRGYDFKFYDLAVRYTWMFIAEADRRQLEMYHAMALDADNKLLYNKVMKTLFNSLNVQGVGDKNEPVMVYKLYNGDGEVPPAYKTTTFSGSHTHYLTSGNSALTSANVDTLIADATSHGFTMDRGYRLVLWVNPQESARIKTWRVAGGASFDFVPNPGLANGAVWVPGTGSYQGGPSGVLPGQIGTYGPYHVVEESYIPAGYVVSLSSGGPDALGNPVGIREHANPAYRGLKIIPGQRTQYPLLDSFYRRGFGTGIRQRGGGLIMQVTTNPTYTIPAAYV